MRLRWKKRSVYYFADKYTQNNSFLCPFEQTDLNVKVATCNSNIHAEMECQCLIISRLYRTQISPQHHPSLHLSQTAKQQISSGTVLWFSRKLRLVVSVSRA